MTDANCPDRETLLRYSMGLLADAPSHALAAHLETCPDCQALIDTMEDVEDTLIGRLRAPASGESYSAESQFRAFLAKTLGNRDEDDSPRSWTGSAAPSLVPQQLGEYQLLENLGRGGMGRVYKALHTRLDRIVALKVLPRGRLDEPKAIVRFEREMKAVGRLAHPNIVQAYDAREINDMPVLMMEFVDGLDLSEIVRRLGPLPVADACELVRQTATALQYAHEHGLVHRDVKPSNIMLARSGEVKLLDLGLARFYCIGSSPQNKSDADEEMTGTGQAMGTADYMAPEQVSDSRSVDIRADLYSLGCTLYKLLCGRAPFSGPEFRTTLDKLNAHVGRPAPSVRAASPDVPEELAALIDRLLAKNPDERFAVPAETAEALAPWCEGADLPALLQRAFDAPPRSQAADAGRPRSSRPTPSPVRKPRKRLLARTIRFAAIVGLGFLLGMLAMLPRDTVVTAFKSAVQGFSSDNKPDVSAGETAPERSPANKAGVEPARPPMDTLTRGMSSVAPPSAAPPIPPAEKADGAPFAVAVARAKPMEQDAETLCGKWILRQEILDGVLQKESTGTRLRLEYGWNQIDGLRGSLDYANGLGNFDIRFTLIPIDQTPKPFQITLRKRPGKAPNGTADYHNLRGIYQVNDKQLTLALVSNDTPAPTTFESKPWSNVRLMVFDRVSEPDNEGPTSAAKADGIFPTATASADSSQVQTIRSTLKGAPPPPPQATGLYISQAAKTPSAQDVEKLRGEWELRMQVDDGTTIQFNGQPLLRLEALADDRLIGALDSPGETEHIQLTLDATKTPKTLRMVRNGQSPGSYADASGIYEVNDKQLVIAVGAGKGAPPPTKFESPPGSGVTLMVFELLSKPNTAKPAAPPESKPAAQPQPESKPAAPLRPRPFSKTVVGTWEIADSTFSLLRKLQYPSEGGPTKPQILRNTKIIITEDAFKIVGPDVACLTFEYHLHPRGIDLQTKGAAKPFGIAAYGAFQYNGREFTICTNAPYVPSSAASSAEPSRPLTLEHGPELAPDAELLILRREGDVPASHPDEKAIEGEWQVEKTRGNAMSHLFDVPGRKVVVGNGGVAIRREQGDVTFGYTLAPQLQPPRFDIANLATPVISPLPCLYKLEGDRLTLIANHSQNVPGAALPPKTWDEGPNTSMVILKRIAPKPEAKPTPPNTPESKPAAVTPEAKPQPESKPAAQPQPESKPEAALKPTAKTKPEAKPAAPPQSALVGTWEVVDSTFSLLCKLPPPSGQFSKQSILQTTKVVITEDAFKIVGPNVACLTLEYRLGPPAGEHKIIDLQTKGTSDFFALTAHGIYQQVGDRLTICTSAPYTCEPGSRGPEPRRPSLLWAELGSDKELLVLRRTGDVPAPHPDEKAIEGEWQVERSSGSAIPHLFDIPGRKMVIGNGNITIPVPGEEWRPSMVGYTLAPQLQPPRFDITGLLDQILSPLPCLYKLEGDRLTLLAYNTHGGSPGRTRPPKTWAEEPDTSVVVFKRIAATPKAKPDAKPAATNTPEAKPASVKPETPQQPASKPAAQPKPEAKPAVDGTAGVKALQGDWKVVRVEKGKHAGNGLFRDGDGNYIAPETISHLQLYDNSLTVNSVEEGTCATLRYTITPGTFPRNIDLQSQGNPSAPLAYGIYELAGDQLKIRLTQHRDSLKTQSRPTEFAAGPDSANVLFVLERYRPSKDEEAFQGDWKVVQHLHDGKPVAADRQRIIAFHGVGVGPRFKASFLIPPRTPAPSDEPQRDIIKNYSSLFYRLDPTKSPKTIQMVGQTLAIEPPHDRGNAGRTNKVELRGIYHLDEKQWTLAYRVDGPAPDSLESKPGSGVTLLVLERGDQSLRTNEVRHLGGWSREGLAAALGPGAAKDGEATNAKPNAKPAATPQPEAKPEPARAAGKGEASKPDAKAELKK